MESPHPLTLNYLSTLSLLLSPHPSLSSSIALQQPLPPAAMDTKCEACRAELVGGLNAAFWAQGGALWARCEGCGWASKRGGGEERVQGSRAAFEGVKKRRRVLLQSKAGELGTLGRKSNAERASQVPSRASSAAASSPKPLESSCRPSPTPSLSSSASPAPAPAFHPPAPKSTARSLPPSRLPTPSPAVSARPSPSPSPALSASSTVSSKPGSNPGSGASTPSSARRKRGKQQPAGLAELLEAKRREKEREKQGASSGAGLMGFLQGI